MAKSMHNFGKHAREKAKQQKQMDKAEKRRMAKKLRANIKTGAPNAESDIVEPAPADEVSKSTA